MKIAPLLIARMPIDETKRVFTEDVLPLNLSRYLSLYYIFMTSPVETKLHCIREAGLRDSIASGCFSLVMGVCDDYFTLKPIVPDNPDQDETDAARFFTITTKLPMELQMLVSNLTVDSTNEIIKTKDLNDAISVLY
jgi:hypothetical protein